MSTVVKRDRAGIQYCNRFTLFLFKSYPGRCGTQRSSGCGSSCVMRFRLFLGSAPLSHRDDRNASFFLEYQHFQVVGTVPASPQKALPPANRAKPTEHFLVVRWLPRHIYHRLCSPVTMCCRRRGPSVTPPSIAIEALVLGGPVSVRARCVSQHGSCRHMAFPCF